MISQEPRFRPRMAWVLLVPLIFLPALDAQDKKDNNLALRVPHTTTHIPIDCTDTSVLWEKVPRVSLSKEAVVDVPADANLPPVLDAMKPIAVIVQMKDPSKPASKLPPKIESKLDSLHEQYAFQWDENRLYGYVEIADHDWDIGHPPVSGKDFKRSPSEAASSDLFFSSVIVQIGAPSWQRWITEMHVHVRPPRAAPMTAMFFGRTNDEENFRELPGEAIACPTKAGWIAKFSVAWLPFEDWHPNPGVAANMRLLVPLAHAQEGYVLGSVVPFVLTK
jgi:hypothetical protein